MMIKLQANTPQAWLDKCLENLPVLLSDHAHCERKAAQAALSLLPYFADNHQVSNTLARLAREEMRHFEQVLKHIHKLGFTHANRPACRYAKALHTFMRKEGKEALVDKMIVAAIIEARSCERFAALGQILEGELKDFYHKLWLAERRHAVVYLEFCRLLEDEQMIAQRLDELLTAEAAIILMPEDCYRFHSGIPV
jgi:tRNA-(ms[2]io[6]A)-hydroxylase